MSGNKDNAGGSFEERLRVAQLKQGIDPPSPAPDSPGAASSSQASTMGVGLRVGVEMVSALAVAVAIGWYLDRWLHSSPAFLVVFVLLGGAAGVANVWRVIGPKPAKPPRP
jgi:ATP synthase protein I